MELPSKLIEAAVDQMSSLPGVGRKNRTETCAEHVREVRRASGSLFRGLSSHEEGDSCMHAMSQPNRGGGLFDLFGTLLVKAI